MGKLTRLIKIRIEDEVFAWYRDVEELKRDLELDGKLVLVTNVKDLSAVLQPPGEERADGSR
ncbi:MAG: hypothetical protein GXP48_11875 [Acidobacteria bacterium]|nr:hypothetical protein [Acidobacteriota bacterium]